MFINMEIGSHNITVPNMNQGSDVTRMTNRALIASNRERIATSIECEKET